MNMTIVAQIINIFVLIAIVMIPILIFKRLALISKNLEKISLELNEIKNILVKNQSE